MVTHSQEVNRNSRLPSTNKSFLLRPAWWCAPVQPIAENVLLKTHRADQSQCLPQLHLTNFMIPPNLIFRSRRVEGWIKIRAAYGASVWYQKTFTGKVAGPTSLSPAAKTAPLSWCNKDTEATVPLRTNLKQKQEAHHLICRQEAAWFLSSGAR